jgi:hypothetical protein
MGYGGYTRHFLVVCSPGGREWTSVRTDFDRDVFNGLRARAEYIIFSERPPTRICPKADDFFKVKFCDTRPACWGDPTENPRNCRTCMHVTPERDGTWTCGCGRTDGKPAALTLAEQRAGCGFHRFHPDLLHDRKVVAGSALAMRYELNSGRGMGGQWRVCLA